MHEHRKGGATPDDPARAGAKQPGRFDPSRADRLDDTSRFEYLPPERVLALLDPAPSALMVDFGAGTGTYAIWLARARPDLAVIALDEQPEMLDRLRAKPETQSLANLRPIFPAEIPGFRGRADRVLALNVLHELGDEALSEVRALLAPHGFALFVDWNAEVDRPHGPPREHVYSPREAAKRLAGFGFEVEMLEGFPYHYVLRARRANSS